MSRAGRIFAVMVTGALLTHQASTGEEQKAASVQIAYALTHLQAVEAAVQDMAKLPPEIRYLTRYFWCGTLPEKEWKDFWRVLSFHVNSLSVEPEIVAPRVLPCATVAAINVLDYGPNWKTVWEKLEDTEPYFHVRLIKVVEKKSKDESGRTVTKKQENAKAVFGPWVEGQALKNLIEGTQSKVPLVRGDWFIHRSSIQADRGEVGYYQWLGIKDQKSYEELIGFDAKILKRFPVEIRDVAVTSAVTLSPRRLDRFGKINGAYWLSSDVKVSQGKANPLQFLNGDFTPDAHEAIATLPNSLHAYALFDANGKFVDSAPDSIASDGFAHSNDRRVHVGFSCVRCHSTENGIRSINGWARNLFQRPLSLQSPDFAKAKRLQRLYFSQIEPLIDDDRRQYVRAVAAASGWDPKDNSKNYEKAFVDYDSPVTVEVAARELCVPKEKLIETIKQQAATTPEIDPVIGSLLSGKPEPIPRVIWEESYAPTAIRLGAR